MIYKTLAHYNVAVQETCYVLAVLDMCSTGDRMLVWYTVTVEVHVHVHVHTTCMYMYMVT